MRTNNLARKLLFLLSLLVASWAPSSCGLNGGIPNQGLPSGTLISQGTLAAGACAVGTPTVSGTVLMYDQGNGTYTANISGISYSGGGCNSLGVMFLANGTYVSCGTITIFSGSQNFGPCGAATAPAQVVFHCLASGQPAPVEDCAVAGLTPTT